ncbi:MAG: sugar phosphate isomerase/epimerase [Planctomycetota bacterium]
MRATDFGVQSYCFRHFPDNAQVAQMVRQIGLDKIEVCAVHADFADLRKWKDVVNTYRDKGVSIVSIGVQTFKGDPAERDWFECAAAAGAKHISAHFLIDTFQDAVPKAAKLAEEYGIRIGVHCHGGYHFCGAPQNIEHLCNLGGDHIGLCLDTAWAMQIGPRDGDALKWVERFGSKVFGVHYKDFVFDRSAQWSDVVVGRGNLNLPKLIHALDDAGFDGMAVIEYEADVEDPAPALKECVRSMRDAVSA